MANEFLAFAADPAANVMQQADYAGSSFLPTRLLGFQTGVAPSAQLNKTWRQASLMSSMLGAFIDQAGMNALDDGNGITTLLPNFTTAVGKVVSTVFPDAPSDGTVYGRSNKLWVNAPAEAPADSGTYGRRNDAWVSLATTTGVPEAPSDGNIYGRLNATWTVVAGGGGGITQAQGDLRYLQLTGGTLTGTLGLLLSGAAGTNRHVMAETGSVWRWEMRLANSDPESTGNLGSNFQLLRYADGGGLIDAPVTISRATGVMNLTQPPTLNGQPIPGLTPPGPPIAVTTPGTSVFNDPGYGTMIYVSMYGAGGSGGPGSLYGGGAGGGGGAHNVAAFRRADLVFPIPLTVGAGGAPVASVVQAFPGPFTHTPDGHGGGVTSFGSYLKAYGGGGGSGGGWYTPSGGGTNGFIMPGGGGGGSMGQGNALGGGSDPLNPQYITGTGGEPFGIGPYPGFADHIDNIGFGGSSSQPGDPSNYNPRSGSSEWGGAAGAGNWQNNSVANQGGYGLVGNTGGASMWGGAGGGSGGGVNTNGGLAYNGGRGGATNAYITIAIAAQLPDQGPGGAAGGAANTNAGMGTALHGNWTYGGQGGPGAGALQTTATGTPVGLTGGRGGDCGGGGGGGGQCYNPATGGPCIGGTSGAGGNGAIFIIII